MQTGSGRKILVLGAGNFGTCLAFHLSRIGNDVTLWSRSQDVCAAINAEHRNPRYLREFDLPPGLHADHELSEQVASRYEVIVVAVPTQVLRGVLKQIGRVDSEQLLVTAAKGIEVGTQRFPLGIIKDVFGADVAHSAAVLSGPSFAIEIVSCQPTAVAMASHDPQRALDAQQVFHDPYFRVYTSADPIGLEVAGAMKNIMAIGAGACAGLGYQNNSRAAIITRGLAEMTRVGVALGALPLTFNGLGGVGDLFLTCSSEKSRNYTVGFRLGRGESLDDILATMGSVAEGVATAKSAHNLTSRMGVSNPITTAIYNVLYDGMPIGEAVQGLMTRDAKPELAIS